MIFNLQDFIATHIVKRKQSMFLNDIDIHKEQLTHTIERKKVLVIGGAGSIGSSFIKALLPYRPLSLTVVDINENALTELSRDLRSEKGLYVPENYITYPMSYADPVFEKVFKKQQGYDIVANFSAHKHIFYEKEKAKQFLQQATYPLVFKTNGGASSSGVSIIENKWKATHYVNRVFGINPYFSFGKIPWTKKWGIPIPKIGMAQKHYVIIQDYIPIKWEWRIIKIGDSYFGHQKLLKGNFASGSDRIGWVEPPKELLFMIKEVCEVGKFDSMAMDVLESIEGKYYINELQSLFGSFLPYQMRINDIPGRFMFRNNDFVFEKGEFNACNSNLLRVADFVNKINNGYY